jgi:hypothetical protein
MPQEKSSKKGEIAEGHARLASLAVASRTQRAALHRRRRSVHTRMRAGEQSGRYKNCSKLAIFFGGFLHILLKIRFFKPIEQSVQPHPNPHHGEPEFPYQPAVAENLGATAGFKIPFSS